MIHGTRKPSAYQVYRQSHAATTPAASIHTLHGRCVLSPESTACMRMCQSWSRTGVGYEHESQPQGIQVNVTQRIYLMMRVDLRKV